MNQFSNFMNQFTKFMNQFFRHCDLQVKDKNTWRYTNRADGHTNLDHFLSQLVQQTVFLSKSGCYIRLHKLNVLCTRSGVGNKYGRRLTAWHSFSVLFVFLTSSALMLSFTNHIFF